MAFSRKQLNTVEELERRADLVRELMNDWLLFNQIFNAYPKAGTNKLELEGQFLKVKGALVREHRMLRDTLQANYNIDGNMMGIISEATDLESMHNQSEIAVKKLTLEWHEAFISINETLGDIEDKKARAEAGETVYITGSPARGSISHESKKNLTNSNQGNAMSVAASAGIGIIALAWIAAWILGMIIHVWTIMISFAVSGMLAAVITLALPVLSEIYWFLSVGSNVGFGTTYCISVMAYAGLLCVPFFGAALVADSQPQGDR